MAAYINGIGAASDVLGDFSAVWERVRAGCVFEPAPPADAVQVDPRAFVRLALSAAKACLRDARLTADDLFRRRTAVVVASSKGGLAGLPRARIGSIEDVAALLPGAASSAIARFVRADGPVFCPVAACASGAAALWSALRMIEAGEADLVLCGASEGDLPELLAAGYERMGVVSEGACRPFDVGRSGFLPCAGAVVLAVESRPGERCYGRLASVRLCSDACDPVTPDPSGDALRRALEAALDDSGVGGPLYVNAHGTGTPLGDVAEARAISAVFSGRADVYVGSTKGATGHWLGAAGALEAAVCAAAVAEGFVPPTAGLVHPDPALGRLPNLGRSAAVRLEAALSISAGFGGHVGVVLIERAEAGE